MAQVINAWFLSQSAIATVLGDWFYIDSDHTSGTCTVYNGDAHNLFGNVCNQSLSELNPTFTTIQGFIITNLALSIIYFLSVYVNPEKIWFKMILGLVMFIIGIITTILWHTTEKTNIPVGNSANYYGVGWFFNIGVILFSFIAMGMNFIKVP
jgi:hypothetical protein